MLPGRRQRAASKAGARPRRVLTLMLIPWTARSLRSVIAGLQQGLPLQEPLLHLALPRGLRRPERNCRTFSREADQLSTRLCKAAGLPALEHTGDAGVWWGEWGKWCVRGCELGV